MPDLTKLNEYQKAAVLDESNTCLVNANVGSGKTTVLIQKILYLHQKKKVPYEKMIVLTFTNKAADEIKERLLAEDKTLDPEQLQCFGTFHSVSLFLLKEQLPLDRVGYQKDFLVIEPDEELEMAMQLIVTLNLKIKYKNRLKKRLEKAMAVVEEEQKVSRYQDDIFLLVDALREEKKKQNKMSFQDLIDTTIQLLELHPIHPSWIIIDEVQDSDVKQIELIQKLKGEKTGLFAVGDPNQVIYSWRGSAFQVFHLLKRLYNATELTLPINYRSSNLILQAAKRFLQNGSNLEGIREKGNLIVVKNHYDAFQEADYLAGKIKELHADGLPYKDIAVFYRLQSQSKIMEDVWSKEGIPYEVSYKKTISDIPVLCWFLKLLRFSVHPEDTTSKVIVSKNKDYGLGQTEVLLQKAEHFLQWLKIQEKEHLFIYDLPQAIWDYFELKSCLRPTSASFVEDQKSVMEFLNILGTYIEEHQLTLTLGIQEFLNNASLYGINILKKDIHSEEDSVKLMTLHASKGLEFSYVFIVGINYGLIPLQSKGFEEEEEERRLFFVGITRAKDNLELSFYTNPDGYRVMSGPSRYLSMIPEELITRDNLKTHEFTQTRLQEIKKEILKSRAELGVLFPEKLKERQDETMESAEKNEESHRQVRHDKYGEGFVVREDDIMITVDFIDYGEKEFVKAFSGLENMT